MQQADQHRRVVERERDRRGRRSSLQLDRERREEHERGERGRADRVALGDGLGRVADRVERVGDVADLLGHVRHLGDAAGVVGDRAERVERDDQAGQRELRHHGDADAVDARPARWRRRCRATITSAGSGRGLQALREALDDVRGVAGLGGPGGRLDRPEARRGVVVGDHEQQRRDARGRPARRGRGRRRSGCAGERRARGREVVHHPLGDREERGGRDDRRTRSGPGRARARRCRPDATAKVPMIDAMIETPPSTSG